MRTLTYTKSDKSTVKCPSQDEALARQFHPRLEKQTLIEERISGHLRVVQPSSENKHWRARERKKHSLKDCKKMLFLTHWAKNTGSLAGRPTLLWKQTLKGEKGILWIVAKIIVIEERISGHFQVLQTLHWKLTPGRKENILWIFVEWLLFDIMRSFQCELFLLSAKRCNAMVEQKTKVFIAPRNFPPPRQAQISHKISEILQYFSDILAVFLKCLIQNILL